MKQGGEGRESEKRACDNKAVKNIPRHLSLVERSLICTLNLFSSPRLPRLQIFAPFDPESPPSYCSGFVHLILLRMDAKISAAPVDEAGVERDATLIFNVKMVEMVVVFVNNKKMCLADGNGDLASIGLEWKIPMSGEWFRLHCWSFHRGPPRYGVVYDQTPSCAPWIATDNTVDNRDDRRG